MATISSSLSDAVATPPVSARLFTAADMAAMPEQLPSGSVSYELHHGVLVPMSPPVERHANIQAIFGTELIIQGQRKGLGKGYTEVGLQLGRGPDHVRGADAAFVVKKSLPVSRTPEGYLETIPQLIVEIRSKNETAKEMAVKVADYLKAGAIVVWVAEPTTESVVEHRSDRPAKTYQASEILTCDDVIPGFHLPVNELFQE